MSVLPLFLPVALTAQTIPVGSAAEFHLRQLQLTGELDSSVSLMVRPIYPAEFTTGRDTLLRLMAGAAPRVARRLAFQLLPLTLEQQYTKDQPYGWNDGSMIAASGYQARISGGVYAKIGPLSVQLRPEVVSASNKNFEGFSKEYDDITWSSYYNGYLNYTDIPERFGSGGYRKAVWGQSSIRLTFDPVSVGISNENLWWGPGKRNALLMSNNAGGFMHLTVNTTRPVRTPVGSFEGQIIAGRLENSGVLPPEAHRSYNGSNLYVPKEDDWRYLSGLVFTYQPKWIPGLYVGIDRAFQIYHKDLDGSWGDYIPVFQPFQKKKTNEANKLRDQLASVFGRYVLKEAQTEVYFQYGWNDHSHDVRDFILDPDHSRTYIMGLSRLFSLRRKHQYLQADIEITQLSQSSSSILRDAGAWYLHSQVRHGYTHKGQVLGAGIGPGSNLQSFSISWIRGAEKSGLQLDRFVHNNDYFNSAFASVSDFSKRWVDLTFTGLWEKQYKNLLINAQASVIRSYNYQWWQVNNPENMYKHGRDLYNLYGKLGVTYYF